jgi:hypothetical protein
MPIFSDIVELKLRDWLTPSQLAKIKYPETQAEKDDYVKKAALKAKRDELEEILFAVCRDGDLEYEGDFGRYVDEIIPNSLPKYPPPGSHIEPQTYKRYIQPTIKNTVQSLRSSWKAIKKNGSRLIFGGSWFFGGRMARRK